MEAGPYLTQIIQTKENQQNSQQKFIRCNQASVKNLSLEPDAQKKPKLSSSGLANKSITKFVADEYYTIKKVKPGVSFYKAILQGEERRKNHENVPELKINLPQTLVLNQNSHQLIYSQRGVVKVRDEIGHGDFVKILQSQKIIKEENGKNQDKESGVYCAALTGVGNGIYTDFSIVLSSELDSRIYPKNQTQISIKFPQPYAQTPNMLRLFYTPKSIKQWKPSYAFKGTNKKRINQQIFSKKHKQLHFYVLDFTKEENIVINTVKGKALEELENMAQSIILYYEFLRNVKIREIVVDFVYASDRKYYFHEIKSIKSANPSPYMLQSLVDQQEHYKQQTNQIQCKLCSFNFPKSQIKHRVTNKLLVQLHLHLKNRGDTTFNSAIHPYTHIYGNRENDTETDSMVKNKYNDLTGLSNVCDLCYDIVVAENKLIMLENVFCQLVCVQPKEIIKIGRQGKGNKGIGFAVEDTELWQWRIFFYIEKIKNFPIQEIGFQQNFTLNMKFNDFKQTFTKRQSLTSEYSSTRPKTSPGIRNQNWLPQCHLPNSSVTAVTSLTVKNSNLHYDKKSTLHTNATNPSQTFFLRENSNVNQNNAVIDFQKIKLITFFTKSQDISQVLFGEDLHFQFWVGSANGNGNNSGGASGSVHFSAGSCGNANGNTNSGVKKYKGRSSTLQNFTNKKQCQRHCCEVLLFGNELQYCNMELSVGLICDGKVSLSEIDTKIQKSSKDYLYYSPGQSMRNCSPLPAQWIQIISQGLVLNNSTIQETSSARVPRQTYQSKFSNSRSYEKDNSTISFGTSLGARPKRPETAKGICSNMIKKRRPFFQSSSNVLTLNNQRKSLRNRKVEDIVNIFEDIESQNEEYL